jgi:hypothetical protein
VFKHDLAMPDSAVTFDYVMNSMVIHGSVNRVVDRLPASRERVGNFGTRLYAGHDWADKVLGRRSMVLMATEAMPRITAAVGVEAAE